MQFTARKRRHPPAIIIVSLIDVLIVVLIFLMVTTTFKQQPSIKLSLPESKEAAREPGEQQALVVTIPKQGPLHLGEQPITLERLQEALVEAVRKNPQATMAIRADTDSAFGQVLKVVDAAKTAKIKLVSAYTKNQTSP